MGPYSHPIRSVLRDKGDSHVYPMDTATQPRLVAAPICSLRGAWPASRARVYPLHFARAVFHNICVDKAGEMAVHRGGILKPGE